MKDRGFTLIELLVVVGIISLISSVVLTSLSVARQRAHIGKAKSEIKVLEQTILRYHVDNGTWPNPAGDGNIDSVSEWNAAWSDPYIATIPSDPWGTAYFYDGGSAECGLGYTGICSAGPNKIFNSWAFQPNIPTGDDICVRMQVCQ